MQSFFSEGKVRKDHMSTPRESALIGAGIAAMVLSRGRPAGIKHSMMGFGALATLGGISHSVNPGAAAIVGAAGTAAFLGIKKFAPQGIQALSDSLARGSGKAIEAKYAETMVKTLKNFPLVGSVIGAAGALITMPVAHSIFQRVLASHRRRISDHGDTAFLPSLGDNQAGRLDGRRSAAPRVAPNIFPADVRVSGQVNSHYDMAHALDTL